MVSPAASAFGKFQDTFLTEIHAEIMSHAQQEATGHAPEPVQGITVHDSEVLEPEPERQGGLFRTDAVSQRRYFYIYWIELTLLLL